MPRTMVIVDEAAIAKFAADPGGPVAMEVLRPASAIVARGARRRVPVLTGALYDSVGISEDIDGTGPFAEVYADWYDRFLETPAKQIPRARRSLRTALRDIPKLL